jgi:hypothetical protein
MALLWIEGFEGVGETTSSAPSPAGIINRKYPTVSGESLMSIETGRFGRCLEIPSGTEYIQSANLTTDTTLVLGCAIRVPSVPVAFASRLLALHFGGTQCIILALNVDQTFSIFRGPSILGTSVNGISIETWYYIELKILTDGSAGSYELRVNGSTWIIGSGIGTTYLGNPYLNSFRLQPPPVSPVVAIRYDDIYLLDGSGPINNDFLGIRKVEMIHPDSPGDASEWTPNTGANWEAVNEEELDGDATYVEASIVKKDLYNFGSISDLATIDGIQIMAHSRVTSGSMDLHVVTKSGATEVECASETIASTTYITTTCLREVNPDTAAKWTNTEINSAQFGLHAHP